MRPTETLQHFAELRLTVSINGVRFPSKLDKQLRYHINGSYLKKHMQYCHRWNEKVWNLIDFDSFGKHYENLSGRKKVQHMKLVHDLQPLGYQKQQMDKETLPHTLTQCPCCRQALETQLHMLHCTHNPSRRKSLTNFIKTVVRRMGIGFLKSLPICWANGLCDTIIPTFEKSLDTFLRLDIIPVELTQPHDRQSSTKL